MTVSKQTCRACGEQVLTLDEVSSEVTLLCLPCYKRFAEENLTQENLQQLIAAQDRQRQTEFKLNQRLVEADYPEGKYPCANCGELATLPLKDDCLCPSCYLKETHPCKDCGVRVYAGESWDGLCIVCNGKKQGVMYD